MSILVWNVRVLNEKSRMKDVQYHIHKFNHSIVAFVEQKSLFIMCTDCKNVCILHGLLVTILIFKILVEYGLLRTLGLGIANLSSPVCNNSHSQ